MVILEVVVRIGKLYLQVSPATLPSFQSPTNWFRAPAFLQKKIKIKWNKIKNFTVNFLWKRMFLTFIYFLREESVFLLSYGSQGWTQVVRLKGKHLYSPNLLTRFYANFLNYKVHCNVWLIPEATIYWAPPALRALSHLLFQTKLRETGPPLWTAEIRTWRKRQQPSHPQCTSEPLCLPEPHTLTTYITNL